MKGGTAIGTATPTSEAPAGEGREPSEAKPLWEVAIMDGSQYCRKSENLVIATKTRQFLRETLFAGFPYKSSTLIPVLHGVTFEEVKEYSGILTDLAEFTTARDSINVIAEKIAAVVQ